ncbi:MAG: hypothetical protein WDZ85_02075 [Candidatus Paceibacterota bacterium]
MILKVGQDVYLTKRQILIDQCVVVSATNGHIRLHCRRFDVELELVCFAGQSYYRSANGRGSKDETATTYHDSAADFYELRPH